LIPPHLADLATFFGHHRYPDLFNCPGNVPQKPISFNPIAASESLTPQDTLSVLRCVLLPSTFPISSLPTTTNSRAIETIKGSPSTGLLDLRYDCRRPFCAPITDFWTAARQLDSCLTSQGQGEGDVTDAFGATSQISESVGDITSGFCR
jgi:hypothetical protein